jgi:anti-sigma factor RsiW
MTCEEARRLFTPALDGRLGSEARAALDAHRASCRGCEAELGRWEAAQRALRARGPTPVPPGLAERAWHAAMESPRRPSLAAGFVVAARRAVVAGALAAGAAWGIALVATPTEGARPAAAGEDAFEVAVQLWAAEVPDDGR